MTERIFLNDVITYRLHVVAEEAIESGEQMFDRLIGCSIREIRLLRIVADYPGINFAEIVRATRLERSLTSRIIQRLLALGLIERKATPEDARRYRLFVTDLGREKRADADRLTDGIEALVLSPLTPEQVRELNRSLEALAFWIRSDGYARQVRELETSLEASSPAPSTRS
jgi:DNA-binding MarR family transcriptional regulator